MEQRLYRKLRLLGRYTAEMMMRKAGDTLANLNFYNYNESPFVL